MLVALAVSATPVAAQEELSVNKILLGGATISNPTGTGVSIGGGTLTAGIFSGSCSLCTAVPAGQLTGTVPAAALAGRSLADLGTRSAGDLSSGNLAWARLPSGSGTWSGAPTIAGHVTPDLSDTYDLGSAFKIWRQAFVSQLNATLFAKETQTLYGGWLSVSKNAGTLAASVNNVQTTVDFGMAMTLNQFVLIRAADNNSGAITHEYMKVGTLVSGTTYNVTRNLSGIGAKHWGDGTPFMVRGVAGDGWLELNAYDTPRMSLFTQGSLYNNSTENLRIGHLTGMPNSSSGIGVYIGDATNFLRYDSTNFVLKSGHFNIDSATGVAIAPSTTATYATDRAYRYTASNGELGLFGFEDGSTRSVSLQSTYTGGAGGRVTDVALTANGAPGIGSFPAAMSLSSNGVNAAGSNISFAAGSYTFQGVGSDPSFIVHGPIRERSRSVAMGDWASVAYNGANFTASGAMTWTVETGDQTTYKYTLVGKTITVTAHIVTSSVGGTLSTDLRIPVPGGHVSANTVSTAGWVLDNGAGAAAVISVSAGGTFISITRADLANFAASAHGTQARFTFPFEIQSP